MARIIVILVFILIATSDTKAISTKVESLNSNSCLIYINISTCKNCQVLIAPFVKSVFEPNIINPKFLLSEKYIRNGHLLLSEFLGINVSSSEVIYNDSIVMLSEKELGFTSSLIIVQNNSISLFNLEIRAPSISLVKSLAESTHVSENPFKSELNLSDYVSLRVFNNDTIIIDRNLGLVHFVDGQIREMPRHIWDIQSLKPNLEGVDIDSTSGFFNIEYSNVISIEDNYWFFALCNEVEITNGQGSVYPTTIAFRYPSNSAKAKSFLVKPTILKEGKKCYFEETGIFSLYENYKILQECGSQNIKPFLSTLEVEGDELKFSRSKKISLKELKGKPGAYIVDYGEDLIYFMGNQTLYSINDQYKLQKVYDASTMFKQGVYLKGANISFTENIKKPLVFLESSTGYTIKKGNEKMQQNGSIAYEYCVLLKNTDIGNIISNVFFSKENGHIYGITSNNSMISINMNGF